jgi:hypothetical protein
MLSVHTLAGAAFQLLADLGKLAGVVSPIRESDRIRPEGKKEWHTALAAPQNFLKHADRDPEHEHEYVEEGTIFLLFETMDLAGRVLKFTGREKLAFETWFVFSFPHLVKPDYLATVTKLADQSGVDPTNRDLWYRWLSEP